MAVKAKRPGKKKAHVEVKSGPSHSHKRGKVVEHVRVLDRANDRYFEKVADYESGELIHYADEPLSKHHGHGSAKKQASVAKAKLMPITNMTKRDEGAGFVIGVGGNAPARQAEPERSSSATSLHTRRRRGAKSKKR